MIVDISRIKFVDRITYKWVRNPMAYKLRVESSSTPVNINLVPRASVLSEVSTYAIRAVVEIYCPGINSDSVKLSRERVRIFFLKRQDSCSVIATYCTHIKSPYHSDV